MTGRAEGQHRSRPEPVGDLAGERRQQRQQDAERQ